jgi:hypothetical protein
MQPTNPPGHPPGHTEPGAPAADDHGGMSMPPAEVIARGYESDTYENATVLSVPLLVMLFFVLAFGTVTAIFYFIAYPKGDPRAHPGAAERNKAPLNERLNRIQRGHEVDQPRLEPLRLREGDARAITRPELPVAAGNSPELHPEDLIPTKERFPDLYAGGGGKSGLDKTMALSDDALKDLFRVQAHGTAPPNSQHVPSPANAGRGASESPAVAPGVPKVDLPAPPPAPAPKGDKEKDKDKGDKK